LVLVELVSEELVVDLVRMKKAEQQAVLVLVQALVQV
jgi:hypothetical protein